MSAYLDHFGFKNEPFCKEAQQCEEVRQGLARHGRRGQHAVSPGLMLWRATV